MFWLNDIFYIDPDKHTILFLILVKRIGKAILIVIYKKNPKNVISHA